MNILHPVILKARGRETEKAVECVIRYRGEEVLAWVPRKLMTYRQGALLLPGWFLADRGLRLPPVLSIPESIEADDELKDESFAPSTDGGGKTCPVESVGAVPGTRDGKNADTM
jgi:hypothetical protein